VRSNNERYWMLETIREYARDRLRDADGVERLARRHAEHYLAVAEGVADDRLQPLQPSGIRVLDDELDNLRAARSWLHDAREADAELRLVSALAEFWDLRGHIREGHSAFTAALDGDAPQSPALRARALADASDFARPLGAVEQARRYAEESLALFRRLDDDRGIARALHELGEAAGDEEDYDRAVELFGEAIAAARRAGDDGAASTANLGYLAGLQGDYRRAASLSEEALTLFRQRGHTTGVLINLGNLSEAELGLGRLEDARRHLAECVELARETQFLGMIVQCLEVAAGLLLETGDAETAARLTGAVDALIDEMDLPSHPAERRRQERLRTDLRAALGPSADELRAEGAAMDAEAASRLVLDALQRSID
jgi:tetratricopeptide (TPR) repeat protein